MVKLIVWTTNERLHNGQRGITDLKKTAGERFISPQYVAQWSSVWVRKAAGKTT